jgi:hypothetical protein
MQGIPGGNPVAMQPAYSVPVSYTPGTTSGATFDARAYGSVTFHCTVAGSAAQALQFSADGSTWPSGSNITGYDLHGNPATTLGLAACTSVTVKGGGFVRLSGGTAGTFLVSAGQ